MPNLNNKTGFVAIKFFGQFDVFSTRSNQFNHLLIKKLGLWQLVIVIVVMTHLELLVFSTIRCS